MWRCFHYLCYTISKKLGTKVSKHEKLSTLAASKSVNDDRLASKALNNNATDDEFRLTKNAMPVTGFQRTIQKATKVIGQTLVEQPDLDKIRQKKREDQLQQHAS